MMPCSCSIEATPIWSPDITLLTLPIHCRLLLLPEIDDRPPPFSFFLILVSFWQPHLRHLFSDIRVGKPYSFFLCFLGIMLLRMLLLCDADREGVTLVYVCLIHCRREDGRVLFFYFSLPGYPPATIHFFIRKREGGREMTLAPMYPMPALAFPCYFFMERNECEKSN